MRTLAALLLVTATATSTAACSARAKPRPAELAPAATSGRAASAEPSSASAAAVAVEARPAGPAVTPIPGLSPALQAQLGLDGPQAPATVDDDAAARLAALSSRYDDRREEILHELTIYRLAGGALTTEHTLELPTPDGVAVKSWAWRNADELVLLFHDGSLRTVLGGTLRPLARPARKLFEVKRPRGSDADRFSRDEGLVATAGGEVWLHHCVWGWSGDDDPCEVDLHVRVGAKPTATRKAPPPRPSWRREPPADWSLDVAPVGEFDTGVLRCRGPGGVSAELPVPDDSFGYSAADAEWLSARPPIQLVKVWYGGMDEAVPVPRLLARCTSVDAEPRRVEVGPAGYWTLGTRDEGDATNDGGALVLWHGRVVGALPRAEQLLFAP